MVHKVVGKGRNAILRPEVCLEPCGIVTFWKQCVSPNMVCVKTNVRKNAENQMKVTFRDCLTQTVSEFAFILKGLPEGKSCKGCSKIKRNGAVKI